MIWLNLIFELSIKSSGSRIHLIYVDSRPKMHFMLVSGVHMRWGHVVALSSGMWNYRVLPAEDTSPEWLLMLVNGHPAEQLVDEKGKESLLVMERKEACRGSRNGSMPWGHQIGSGVAPFLFRWMTRWTCLIRSNSWVNYQLLFQ